MDLIRFNQQFQGFSNQNHPKLVTKSWSQIDVTSQTGGLKLNKFVGSSGYIQCMGILCEQSDQMGLFQTGGMYSILIYVWQV